MLGWVCVIKGPVVSRLQVDDNDDNEWEDEENDDDEMHPGDSLPTLLSQMCDANDFAGNWAKNCLDWFFSVFSSSTEMNLCFSND